jgi:hypothetical protein
MLSGISALAFSNLKSLKQGAPVAKLKATAGARNRKISKFKAGVLKVLSKRGTRFSRISKGKEKEFGFNPSDVSSKFESKLSRF